MTQGWMESLQAQISILFHLPSGANVEIDFVIDTGFEGALTMPAEVVSKLGLPFFQEMSANLADDTSIRTDVHTATITWDGSLAEVVVLAMGRRPLLGTALLAGKELTAQFIDSGKVIVDEL